MRDTITAILNEIVRSDDIVAEGKTGGNFASYINLKNMEAGDSVSFWLEFDIDADGVPEVGSSPAVSLDYEDLVNVINAGTPEEQTLYVNAWGINEPIVLEENQVVRVAVLQTAGLAKDFPFRVTNLATGQ